MNSHYFPNYFYQLIQNIQRFQSLLIVTSITATSSAAAGLITAFLEIAPTPNCHVHRLHVLRKVEGYRHFLVMFETSLYEQLFLNQ